MADSGGENYRIVAESPSRKGITYTGAAVVSLIIALGVLGEIQGHIDPIFWFFFLPLIALLFTGISRARRSLELRIDGFSFFGLGRRDYSLADFQGYRITTTHGRYGNVRSYRLEGQPGHRSVTLLNDGAILSFNQNDIRFLKTWLSEHLPDLEARDRNEELLERRDARISGRRVLTRASATRIARFLNWTVSLAAFAAYFSFSWGLVHTPALARVISVGGLFLLPGALAVKLWSPSSFQFGSLVGGGSPPSIDLALLLGSLLAVAMEWLLCQPLRWSAAIVPVTLATALLCAISFEFALGRRDRTPATIGFVGLLLALYSLGAVLVMNAAFDSRRPRLEGALILERSKSPGRRETDYYWTLGFPARSGFERKVRVSRRLYEMYRIDSVDAPPVPVPVTIGPGALGIEWIRGFGGI